MSKLVWIACKHASGHGYFYEAATGKYKLNVHAEGRRKWMFVVDRWDYWTMDPAMTRSEPKYTSARAARAAAQKWLEDQEAK